MWSFLGITLALFAQTLQTSPQIETFLANTNKLKVPQTIISPTPFKQRIANRFAETQPTPSQYQAQEQIALKPHLSPTQAKTNESSNQALNNRSGKVNESVAPQAIVHSPALDPCTPSTCASPTPKPTRAVEPTRIPFATSTPRPTPITTIFPLPTVVSKPPRCPSVPPHLTKSGDEPTFAEDPIYCLD